MAYIVEFFLWIFLLQFIKYTHFGANDEFIMIACRRIINDFRGASDEIRKFKYIPRTLRVGQYQCIRMKSLCFFYIFRMNAFMYMAVSIMENKLFFRQFARHIAAKVIVRDKENAFVWQGFYDTQRIGRSHTHIRVCFNFSCRIYITHDSDIFVLLSDFFDPANIYHMCHRTVCVLIRHDNAFSRIQYLRTLSHKGNATE